MVWVLHPMLDRSRLGSLHEMFFIPVNFFCPPLNIDRVYYNKVVLEISEYSITHCIKKAYLWTGYFPLSLSSIFIFEV